jgi:ribose/xylose/arabinose/galactoside ABC-type transport system permease subunit
MSKFLITLGIILVVAGLLWPLLQKSGLGRLPGDFVIERGNATIYIPLATSLLVSLVLTLIFWLIGR